MLKLAKDPVSSNKRKLDTGFRLQFIVLSPSVSYPWILLRFTKALKKAILSLSSEEVQLSAPLEASVRLGVFRLPRRCSVLWQNTYVKDCSSVPCTAREFFFNDRKHEETASRSVLAHCTNKTFPQHLQLFEKEHPKSMSFNLKNWTMCLLMTRIHGWRFDISSYLQFVSLHSLPSGLVVSLTTTFNGKQ